MSPRPLQKVATGRSPTVPPARSGILFLLEPVLLALCMTGSLATNLLRLVAG